MSDKKTFKKYNFYLGIIGLISLFLLWEISSRFNLISPILISSPAKTFNAGMEMFATKSFYHHLFVSLKEILLGIGLAVFFGVLIGMLFGLYEKLNAFFSFMVFGLYSTPKIAVFPLIVIWLGFGLSSKVTLIFLSGFFPILIATMDAAKNLNPDFIRLGKAFGAKDYEIFTKIAFPSCFPYIMSGLRIAIPRMITGMVVAEFFVSNEGIGYLINYYGGTFQTGPLLAAIFVVVTLSITLTSVVGLLEKRINIWKFET